MQEPIFCLELRLVGNPGWSSLFLKDCTPRKGPKLEQLMKDCILPGTHAGEGEKFKEEGVAVRKLCELAATPTPHPPLLHSEGRK